MATDKTATFGIRIPVDTNAEKAASSVESLNHEIAAAQKAVGVYAQQLRLLRGGSDEVTAAKQHLKAAISAERDAASRAVLELGKMGAVYQKTAGDTKKFAQESKEGADKVKALHSTLGRIGGPIGEARGALAELTEGLTAASTAGGALAISGAALVVGFVAVAAGAAYATGKVASFILESGNLLRAQGLQREAFLGNADDARRFGNQIEETRSKLPLTREELNELAVSASKLRYNSRLSGQGVVDMFNAVAGAAAAQGPAAGKQIEDVIARFRKWGRFGLSPRELDALGISFQDVSKRLAKNLKIGLGQAQLALLQGRIDVNAGAKAIRDAVESRFGAVNAKKLIDLEQISRRFHDNITGLTKDLSPALEPALHVIDRLARNFDSATVNGAALRQMVTTTGKLLSGGFEKAEPIMQHFFDLGINYALKFEIAVLRIALHIKGWVKDIQEFMGYFSHLSKSAGQTNPGGSAIPGVGAVKKAGTFLGAGLNDLANSLDLRRLIGGSVDAGSSAAQGLANGIAAGGPGIAKAAAGASKAAATGAREGLDMHSPSKVMRGLGKQAGDSFAMGQEDAAPAIAESSQRTVMPRINIPRGREERGAQGGGGGPVTITFAFPNAKDGEGVRTVVQSDDFKVKLTRVLLEIFQGAGVQTQTSQATIA